MQIFSERLRELRRERGLKQRELAELIGSNPSNISGYEREGKMPDMETVCSIAEVFGVSTDYLLGFSDEKNHIEVQFPNDTVQFKEHYDNLSDDNKELVDKCLLDLYKLLESDVKTNSTNRLTAYEKLLNVLQEYRTDIQKSAESSDDVTDIMFKEMEFKNAVSILLDKLMRTDLEN